MQGDTNENLRTLDSVISEEWGWLLKKNTITSGETQIYHFSPKRNNSCVEWSCSLGKFFSQLETNLLPCYWVMMDTVWMGNQIYCTLTDRNYSAITNTIYQALSLVSLMCFHRLSGNGFKRHRSLSFCVHVLTGLQLSHS
jgi:hypothetical protein